VKGRAVCHAQKITNKTGSKLTIINIASIFLTSNGRTSRPCFETISTFVSTKLPKLLKPVTKIGFT